MKQFIIECPECGANVKVEVPDNNTCIVYAKCHACEEEIFCKDGHCCVISSYSDIDPENIYGC